MSAASSFSQLSEAGFELEKEQLKRAELLGAVRISEGSTRNTEGGERDKVDSLYDKTEQITYQSGTWPYCTRRRVITPLQQLQPRPSCLQVLRLASIQKPKVRFLAVTCVKTTQ